MTIPKKSERKHTPWLHAGTDAQSLLARWGFDPDNVARDRVNMNAGDSIGLVHQVAAALIIKACPSDPGDWPSPS